MPLYFAVSEGFYEAAKLLVARHVQLGVGLDLSVKVIKRWLIMIRRLL